MSRKISFAMLAAGCLFATAMALPGAAVAQDAAAKVKTSMAFLKAEAEKIGSPKLEGTDKVVDKDVPALYFGGTKMNNNYALVDDTVKQNGGTATIFVKSGDEYVRVATNVKKGDGSRATGTILDPNGKAIAAIKADQPFYGEVDILGKLYVTGYEPIHDAGKQVIGILYVGYAKE
jgi:hypothetical protein